MPFEVKGPKALSAKIAVRLAPDEKAKLKEDAGLAALSISELVRRRYFGRPIVADANLQMIRELRRIGGLLKHVHTQSSGAYSAETATAIANVNAFIGRLARGFQED